MANLLTAIRLLLALPVTIAIANAEFMPGWLLLTLILIAIASDYFDGKVARLFGSASARGQLFDHSTDFLFVSSGLAALSMAGITNPVLPLLIVIAFTQYVLDSHYLFKQKHLRMSFLGRCNGIFYFVPLLVVATSRLEFMQNLQQILNAVNELAAYGLTASTLASIVDRAIAPLRNSEN